jgi:hypothetical protein
MRSWRAGIILTGLMMGLLGAAGLAARAEEAGKSENGLYTLYVAMLETKGPLPYEMSFQRTQALNEKAKSFPVSSDIQDFLANLKKCYPGFNFKVVTAGAVAMREAEPREAEFFSLQPENGHRSFRIAAIVKSEPETTQVMTQILVEYRSSRMLANGLELPSTSSFCTIFGNSGLGYAGFGEGRTTEAKSADGNYTLVLMSLSPGGIWDKKSLETLSMMPSDNLR